MRVCVITRVTCNDSSHSLTRVNMRSSQSQVRVISQVTRVKSSHLGEISSQVKSSQVKHCDSSPSQWHDLLQHCIPHWFPFCSVLQILSVIINKILYSVCLPCCNFFLNVKFDITHISRFYTLKTLFFIQQIFLVCFMQPTMTPLRLELIALLMPIFLGNHPNSGIVLHYAWHGQVSQIFCFTKIHFFFSPLILFSGQF